MHTSFIVFNIIGLAIIIIAAVRIGMKISKAGSALSGGVPEESELALIRSYARAELAAEEVYTFPVLLCDNEVDRDYERFDEETLKQLAELFVGKTGISDHEWRAAGQVARIYRTEIVRDPERKTAAGDGYVGLKAWAYMLRTDANAALIADIEGGIKKEVSVGCSVAERLCSICGKPAGNGGCVHAQGGTSRCTAPWTPTSGASWRCPPSAARASPRRWRSVPANMRRSWRS